MPSSYNNNLRLEMIATGEQSGTWGQTTNTNLGTLLVAAITGKTSITSSSSPYTLTALNGTADESRAAALELNCTGANFIVIVPTVTKLYVVENVNATDSVTVKTASGSGVTVPPLKTVLLRCDGTNVIEQLDHVVGNFSVGTNFTADGTVNVLGSAFLGVVQSATINVATPAVITVASSPVSGTAVVFTTTGVLPAGLTAGTIYYVSKINATTFNVSTSSTLSPLVATSNSGSGTHTVTTTSLAITPPTTANNTQLATTAFVKQFIDTTNWAISETVATQTATITIASPAVVTVTTSPANGTAVSFSTTGALPTGVTANQPYYVANRASTTYNLASAADVTQAATLAIASPGVVTVPSAPQNGDQVVFATTGTLPTGITAGTVYYVINRTSVTFEVSATSGGVAIDFTGSYTGDVTVASRTLVNTSGSQSGTHTETTSKLYFKYKSIDRLSIDLGGNLIVSGNVTAYGTV
jgi:hypothetical protein